MSNIVRQNPFLAPPEQLLASTDRLMRLVRLSNALPMDFTSRALEATQLMNLCKRVHKLASTEIEKVRQEIDQKLHSFNPKLRTFVQPLFQAVMNSPRHLQVFAEELMGDAKTIGRLLPIKKSHRGNKGPTLLARYFKLNTTHEIVGVNTGVIKWTNWTEIASHRIYHVFARTLGKNNFLVPKAMAYDLEKRVSEKLEGNRTQLEGSLATRLQSKFKELKAAFVDPQQYLDEQMMFFERIEGENLFDFVQTKYDNLTTQQKESFFATMGQIALLDILLGNLDRFAQVFNLGEGEYVLMNLEANLGNLMISWQGDGQPRVYAIDNGVNEQLVSDPREHQKYLQFLKELFGKEKMAEVLADNMKQSFLSAVRTQVDDCPGNVAEVRRKLEPFKRDLESMASDAFLRGIVEMATELQQRASSFWEGDEQAHLKSYLSEHFPEFFTHIDERIQLFLTTTKPTAGAAV